MFLTTKVADMKIFSLKVKTGIALADGHTIWRHLVVIFY